MKKKFKRVFAVIIAAIMLSCGISAYADSMVVVNCNEWVSLRSYPSTSAERLTTVPLGARVESIGWQNGFNQVIYNGLVGWILTSYLAYDSYVYPNYYYSGGDIMYVVNCNEWVSLRSYPSVSAPRLDTVPLGAQVESIGWQNGFNQVIYNGQVGWVLTSYLSYWR